MCAKFQVKIWLGSDFRQRSIFTTPLPTVKPTTIKNPARNNRAKRLPGPMELKVPVGIGLI